MLVASIYYLKDTFWFQFYVIGRNFQLNDMSFELILNEIQRFCQYKITAHVSYKIQLKGSMRNSLQIDMQGLVSTETEY